MKTIFERKGKIIRYLVDDTSKAFDSINLAKRESRNLQDRNGGLGRGSLRLA